MCNRHFCLLNMGPTEPNLMVDKKLYFTKVIKIWGFDKFKKIEQKDVQGMKKTLRMTVRQSQNRRPWAFPLGGITNDIMSDGI